MLHVNVGICMYMLHMNIGGSSASHLHRNMLDKALHKRMRRWDPMTPCVRDTYVTAEYDMRAPIEPRQTLALQRLVSQVASVCVWLDGWMDMYVVCICMYEM